MIYTVLAAPLNMLVKALEQRSIDGHDLLRRAGFDPSLLEQPGARYSEVNYPRLWELVLEATGDPCIGLAVIRHLHVGHLHALGYAWLASDSLKDALERLCRYAHVLSNRDELILKEGADDYRLIPRPPTGNEIPPSNPDSDVFVAGVVQLCRLSYGDDFSPLRVEIAHEKPPCWHLFFEYFRCPVEFGSAQDSIIFDRESLERRLPTGNAELAHANDAVIKRYIALMDKSHVANRVREKLLDHLPSGHANQNWTARALNVSTRSLQRQLREEGTSYKWILDEVRQELARQYMKEPNMPIKEVTFMLGFSEVSNFTRAFKRWTGQTPATYQAAHAHPEPN